MSHNPHLIEIKRALISVSDKTGIVELARDLRKHKVEIISTGGTSKALKDAGIPVMDISEVTGFPEMLDGRVKTLHPKIHGGLLAVRTNKEHMDTIANHDITPIDMVIVNLYPFEKTISNPNCKFEDAIENIDIGGPSMIRSAAKNFHGVCVVVSPAFYPAIIGELEKTGGFIGQETRDRMMIEVFKQTYEYDMAIYNYFSKQVTKEEMPVMYNCSYKKTQGLRYGENPHQKASFYVDRQSKEPSVSKAKQLHGKELSYNNIMDTNAAVELVKEFSEPACAIIKHTNPCGTAIGKDIDEAFKKAFETDPLSAFGGIIALNRKVTKAIAEYLSGKFIEVVVAPEFEKAALETFELKKNIRLLVIDGLGKNETRDADYDLRKVVGGLLVQERDLKEIDSSNLLVVTKKSPVADEQKDMLFGWKVCKHVKSNAIVIVKDGVTLGVGAGQMNRVGSVKIAAEQAGPKAKGAVLISDALFPKPDGVEAAVKAGISAIIQTGGSISDKEVIEAADKAGISMVFTNIRHFKH